ncbi:MAG: class I SAM-dependent methyltransferase [Bryobacteraceae bacterium]
MRVRLLMAGTLLCSALLFGQKPEYDFYGGFRAFMSALWVKNPSITSGQILEAYTAKLKSEGVPDVEIARRHRLLTTERAQLEADRWDRFYQNSKNKEDYNESPNAFLMAFVADRRPGVALDYAMGTGRNALYLAKLGWEVYGFDHSAVAVAMAQKRANELGLRLHAAAVSDSEYEFGKERFDLIVFSWAMPLTDVRKVVDALKPGGVVLMECAVDYVGRNGMLKLFDDLRIERYEILRTVADWYDRRETETLRLVATKR